MTVRLGVRREYARGNLPPTRMVKLCFICCAKIGAVPLMMYEMRSLRSLTHCNDGMCMAARYVRHGLQRVMKCPPEAHFQFCVRHSLFSTLSNARALLRSSKCCSTPFLTRFCSMTFAVTLHCIYYIIPAKTIASWSTFCKRCHALHCKRKKHFLANHLSNVFVLLGPQSNYHLRGRTSRQTRR